RLDFELDERDGKSLAVLEQVLAQYRPGATPIRLELLLPHSRGALDCNGSFGVRAVPDLIGALRALPCVRHVRLAIQRPALGREGGGERYRRPEATAGGE